MSSLSLHLSAFNILLNLPTYYVYFYGRPHLDYKFHKSSDLCPVYDAPQASEQRLARSKRGRYSPNGLRGFSLNSNKYLNSELIVIFGTSDNFDAHCIALEQKRVGREVVERTKGCHFSNGGMVEITRIIHSRSRTKQLLY